MDHIRRIAVLLRNVPRFDLIAVSGLTAGQLTGGTARPGLLTASTGGATVLVPASY
jgi:hypothetical protein